MADIQTPFDVIRKTHEHLAASVRPAVPPPTIDVID